MFSFRFHLTYTSPVISSWLIGFNHNFIALANVDVQNAGGVRIDRYKIGRDDSHCVSIKSEFKMIVD